MRDNEYRITSDGERSAGFILFCLLLFGAAMIAYCAQRASDSYPSNPLPYMRHQYRVRSGSPVILLNNLDLTPGVVRTINRKEICEGGSTKQFRNTTEKMKLEMCARYGMPWHCWGPGDRKVSQVNPSSHDIFPMSDSLKVGGVNAIGVSAQMVDFSSQRYRSSQNEPEEYMGAHALELKTSNGKRSASVSSGLHPLSSPEPTSARSLDDFSENGLFDGTRTTAVEGARSPAEHVAHGFGLETFAALFAFPFSNSARIVLPETLHRTILSMAMPFAYEGFFATSALQFEGHDVNFTPKTNPCLHGCEGDHLISLELGGEDDVDNLWPQPYEPNPGARQKDTVENWLHKQICTGKMEPQEAQRRIATDWYAVFIEMNKLPSGMDGARLGPEHWQCDISNDCDLVQNKLSADGKPELSALGCFLAKTRITWILGDRTSMCVKSGAN